MIDNTLRPQSAPGSCLQRVGDLLALRPCANSTRQQWLRGGDSETTLADPDGSVCVDNMQRQSGAPGLYGCHGGSTQQWQLTPDGQLASGPICLGLGADVGLALCHPGDQEQKWQQVEESLRPDQHPDKCLTRNGDKAVLQTCDDSAAQHWSVSGPGQ